MEKEEVLELLKEIVKESKERAKSVGPIFCFLASLLIITKAFFPLINYDLAFLSTPLLLIIFGIMVIILFVYITPLEPIDKKKSLIGILVGVILISFVILLIAFSPSPQLFKFLRTAWSIYSYKSDIPQLQAISGVTAAYIALAILLLIAGILCFKLRAPYYYLIPLILWIGFFITFKPVLAVSGVYQYIGVKKIVKVEYKVPYKTVQVSGGVTIKYGTKETRYRPATLLGGEPYIYYYTIQNLYDRSESFRLNPYIEIKYQNARIKFKVPYEKELTIKGNFFYSDQVYYDPNVMSIETANYCPYTIAQIAEYYGINISNITETELNDLIPCAYDKVCESKKQVCVETFAYRCDCLGWVGLTCGGAKSYMKMDVWHTGFLKGIGTLFYKEEYFEPIANTKIQQGPFSIIPIFFPNPWVGKIHKEKGSFGLELESTGGEIKINNIKIKPRNTIVYTTISGFSEDLDAIIEATVKEEIGITMDCKSEKITIPSGVRVFKEFCSFSKPEIKVSIVNTTIENITSSVDIDIEKIEDYCEKGLKVSLDLSEATESQKKVINEINKFIEKTGLCEMLEKAKTGEIRKEEKKTFAEEWEEQIKNSLKKVDVVIEIDYEREFTSTSKSIEINTNTEKCLKFSCCYGGKNIYCPEGMEDCPEDWKRPYG